MSKEISRWRTVPHRLEVLAFVLLCSDQKWERSTFAELWLDVEEVGAISLCKLLRSKERLIRSIRIVDARET